MQTLTAPPRDHLTEAQVRALLTGSRVRVDAGLELLDTQGRFVEDISADLQSRGSSIDYSLHAAVHRSCRLNLLRELAWGRDRVLPYVTLSNGALAARFNLGVYVLTTPIEPRGQTPPTYQVEGYDLLTLLHTNGPGDTYTVEPGTTYMQAIRDVLDVAGTGTPVLLDGTSQNITLTAPMVWALTQTPVTWLGIVNDLLTAIAYRPLWADENGALRSAPIQPGEDRPLEWTFDTADLGTNLVHQDRSLESDVWKAPNWWRFVRNDSETAPTEGAGVYTVTNQADGPSSIDALGRSVRRPPVFLDVADHAALVAQGDRIVADDRRVTRTFSLSTDPLPILGHDDWVKFTDQGQTDVTEVSSWTLNLDGTPGALVLGGPTAEPTERREEQAKATVTTASPLTITLDGATTACPAYALDGTSYAAAARVTTTTRNPAPPLVQGIET